MGTIEGVDLELGVVKRGVWLVYTLKHFPCAFLVSDNQCRSRYTVSRCLEQLVGYKSFVASEIITAPSYHHQYFMNCS